MKIQPFSVAVDGSNDTGLEKMNPMTVRLYDVNQGSIVTRFLDMCLTKGTESATAASIFKKMDDVLKENGISWSNCVGVFVDNTSVNLGKRNSIMTRVLQNNTAVYFTGCPCHIMHNTCMKAAETFTQNTRFDVEDMMIDIFYHFDKSTKRKAELAEYCEFCNVEFRQVLKHVSTRWLSLELVVTWTLQQYPALKSYFLSQSDGNSNARVDRLKAVYSEPMSEVYLLFYQAALQPSIKINKFLQREDPIISVMHAQFNSFLKKLFGRFVTITAIQEADMDITGLDYNNPCNQLPDTGLFVGIMTRQVIRRLEDGGDISAQQVKGFYIAVRGFYATAATYALANLPLKDEVLQNSQFINFGNRASATITQVSYFLERFPTLLNCSSVAELNKIEDEFLQYQLMRESDIPECVWQCALVVEDQETRHHRMDIIWSHMKTMKHPDGSPKFEKLADVALLVLTLPHSNAEEERVFSLVTKNKTKFRANLKLDGTLSSIIAIKLANTVPCQKYEPPREVLESARKATMTYNRAHSSKHNA